MEVLVLLSRWEKVVFGLYFTIVVEHAFVWLWSFICVFWYSFRLESIVFKCKYRETNHVNRCWWMQWFKSYHKNNGARRITLMDLVFVWAHENLNARKQLQSNNKITLISNERILVIKIAYDSGIAIEIGTFMSVLNKNCNRVNGA